MRLSRIGTVLLAMVLTSCGGGGSSSSSSGSSGLPPTRPYGTVSGYAIDALIANGTVNVYSFANGTQGPLLGTGTTDLHGYYDIALQAPSQPIEIQVTGGYYNEEASGAQVTLQPGQQLLALANYVSGQPVTVVATSFTNLAAGLAQFKMAHGIPVGQAIDAANTEVSNLIGVNIETVRPLNITNSANQSAGLNPGLQYGFFEAAISEWTNTEAIANGSTQVNGPYTSIAFAQEMYDDVVSDGVLDGNGLTQYGPENPLSLGAVALGTDSYRHELAIGMIRIASVRPTVTAGSAGATNVTVGNATSIPATALTPVAQKYNNATDPLFNGANPLPFVPTTPLSLTLPAWGRGTITAQALANDPFGFASLDLQVGTAAATLMTAGSGSATTTNVNSTFSLALNTPTYSDGSYTVTVSGTDAAGYTYQAQATLPIDNVAPTLCWPTQPSNTAITELAIADDFSGPASLSMNGTAFSNTGSVHGSWQLWTAPIPQNAQIVGPVSAPTPQPVQAVDRAGNVLNIGSTSIASCGF